MRRCAYEGCDKEGEQLATGRRYVTDPGHDIAVYCDEHATKVANEGNPECVVECPNCTCKFGVN